SPIQQYEGPRPAGLRDDPLLREYDQLCLKQDLRFPADLPGMIPIRIPSETRRVSAADRVWILDKVPLHVPQTRIFPGGFHAVLLNSGQQPVQSVDNSVGM